MASAKKTFIFESGGRWWKISQMKVERKLKNETDILTMAQETRESQLYSPFPTEG